MIRPDEQEVPNWHGNRLLPLWKLLWKFSASVLPCRETAPFLTGCRENAKMLLTTA